MSAVILYLHNQGTINKNKDIGSAMRETGDLLISLADSVSRNLSDSDLQRIKDVAWKSWIDLAKKLP